MIYYFFEQIYNNVILTAIKKEKIGIRKTPYNHLALDT